MKFAIFGLIASVDIRPLPGVLGVVLGVQDHKKIKFLYYSSLKQKYSFAHF